MDHTCTYIEAVSREAEIL